MNAMVQQTQKKRTPKGPLDQVQLWFGVGN